MPRMSEGGTVGTRLRGLAALAIIGIATTVTACGSAASSVTQPTAPASAAASQPATQAATAAAIPAGDHRIGGAAQGISIEVPASFMVIDLGSLPQAKAALRKLGLSGAKAATITQSIPALQKVHGVIAVDAASASHGFAGNLNAYCVDSGTDLTGSDLVPALKQGASELQQNLGAKDITSTDEQVGGVPGLKTSYQLQSSGFGAIYGTQLEVAPKPHKACFVTLTEGQSAAEILSVAAASAQFY
jgi:hypothetical protein